MTGLPNAGGPGPIRPASSTQPAAKPGPLERTEGGSAAFQALLDRLHARARELEELKGRVADPAELGRAVDTARASLEDAVSLGDRLLEAYRAERQGGAEGNATGDGA